MEKEIWKEIKGYEGIYMVSNLGRIKSNSRYVDFRGGRKFYKGRFLKGYINDFGYNMITLHYKGNKLYKFIHRFVAEAFIPNIDNKLQINHKDGNKLNNNIDNLEWCTASENIQYSYKVLGRKGMNSMKGRLGKDNPNSKKVYQYNLEGNLIREWDSIADIRRVFGYNGGGISSCCLGYVKKVYGYIRKYNNNFIK